MFPSTAGELPCVGEQAAGRGPARHGLRDPREAAEAGGGAPRLHARVAPLGPPRPAGPAHALHAPAAPEAAVAAKVRPVRPGGGGGGRGRGGPQLDARRDRRHQRHLQQAAAPARFVNVQVPLENVYINVWVKIQGSYRLPGLP